MNIRHFSVVLCVTAVVSLAGCGGGACGEKSQSFGVSFAVQSLTLPTGKPTSLQSVVTPESCRSSMKFSVFSGQLPVGMELDNGNVVGTPTVAGAYRFQVSITNVDGYEPISIPPRSSQITVNVVPLGGTL